MTEPRGGVYTTHIPTRVKAFWENPWRPSPYPPLALPLARSPDGRRECPPAAMRDAPPDPRAAPPGPYTPRERSARAWRPPRARSRPLPPLSLVSRLSSRAPCVFTCTACTTTIVQYHFWHAIPQAPHPHTTQTTNRTNSLEAEVWAKGRSVAPGAGRALHRAARCPGTMSCTRWPRTATPRA